MLLSDETIQEYILAGKIQVFPQLNMADIRPAGIRLHLDNKLLIPFKGQTIDLDSTHEIHFEKITIPEDGFMLGPGQFVLGSTLESFQVPRNIVCHVDGRSTVARLGLAVHCTSATIDGNFEQPRTIVLEISNHGPFEIILRYKSALAMLSFTQLTTDIRQKTQQQYAGQVSVLAPNLVMQKK